MKSYCNDLRLKLTEVINNSSLPIDIKYYIVKDVYLELTNVFEQYLLIPEEKENNDNEKENIEEIIETNVPLEFDETMKEIVDLGIKAKEEELNNKK